MITVSAPYFADQSVTNAQNPAVKEGVARMAPSCFRGEASLANCMKQARRSFRGSCEWRA
jgi:hypothetical protein